MGEPEDGPESFIINSSGKHSAMIYILNEEWFMNNAKMKVLRIEFNNGLAERIEISFKESTVANKRP